ncbi:uncharacterized protein TRIADDRAFT_61290 [Trichoplax adhaerens]|uniref:Uncharacterized protein n=1 Tax=Trichoplax adhaerens TaxID=10228 RepID=B3SAK3_TRIAD|nr:predicted protein [Trichoplax adhaerens]EDV20327.1 predicted protein [Trichoplax adhaerens]|eukprot:XP_002117277.1 predicted protein [Trichoplax adhaerens]
MEGLSIGSSNNLRKEILITSTPFTNQGGKERLRWKHLSPRFNWKRRLNGSLGRFTPNNQAQGDKALDYSPKATIKAQTEAKSITFITIPDSNSDEECKDNSQNRTPFTSLGEKEDCRRKDSSYFVKSKRRRLNNNFNRSPTSGNQVQGNSAFNYSPKATINAQTAAKSITYITISDNSSDEECKNNNQNPSNRALIKAKKECKRSDNAKKYEQLTSGIPNDTFLNQRLDWQAIEI